MCGVISLNNGDMTIIRTIEEEKALERWDSFWKPFWCFVLGVVICFVVYPKETSMGVTIINWDSAKFSAGDNCRIEIKVDGGFNFKPNLAGKPCSLTLKP